MKRKVKKFGKGGDILTGLGAGVIGYHLYDKYMNKDKDKEEKESGAVGGPGRRPRTIEEQTGRKAESKDREIKDYMINKPEEKKGGETRPGPDTAEPNLDYKDKAPVKKSAPVNKDKPAAQPTKTEPRAKATDKVGAGYENVGKAAKSVVFKDATEKKSTSAEAPAKIGSQGSFKFDSKPDLSVPKAFDMKSGNKTVYGTDTTSVFQKQAARARAEAEEKAKKKEKDEAQAKEFRERSLQPMKKGGAVKKYASGGSVSSASKRADGIAQRGKTRGRVC